MGYLFHRSPISNVPQAELLGVAASAAAAQRCGDHLEETDGVKNGEKM